MGDLSLLQKVASSENLWKAFKECARGKRATLGYQKFMYGAGERLAEIQSQLLGDTYSWQGYREFIVKDPKARVIMAAPFCDRVVHHAIHRVIEPIFEPLLSDRSYACRKGKGTSRAVLDLSEALGALGTSRFVVKLDVENFFASISQDILLNRMVQVLPDGSLLSLLNSLIRDSHQGSSSLGKGIPIGNLTSQLFANWILTPADKFIERYHSRVRHFRYMDDFVILAIEKKDALDCAHAAVTYISKELELNIPFTKVMPLASDPVPFLGYLLSHDGYKILARNRGRFQKHLGCLQSKGAPDSRVAQAVLSYNSWTLIPEKCKKQKG
jgi:hypothetical protein